MLVEPCNARGRVPAGAETVEGRASLVDEPAEVARIGRLVFGRYPVLGRLLPLLHRARRQQEVAISVTSP